MRHVCGAQGENCPVQVHRPDLRVLGAFLLGQASDEGAWCWGRHAWLRGPCGDPVYRVQIRLATAAAAPVSKYSRSARAVAARRRRTTKRTMAEEDQRKQVSPTVDVMERSARRVAALQTVPCLFCRNLGTFHRFSNAGWSQLLASHLGLAVTLSQLTRPPRPSGQLGTGLNRPTPIKVNLVAQDASVSARIL